MSTVLTLVYKSGAKVQVTVDEFTAKTRDGDLTSMNWSNMKPKPLHLGINDIAAIFEGKV